MGLHVWMGVRRIFLRRGMLGRGKSFCIAYGVFDGWSKAERWVVILSWIGEERECGCTKC